MSNFSSIGSSTNNNQLNLWNGYFYSRDGWLDATSINKNNCLQYGMVNTLPVFHGTDDGYKYVIFKYTRTMPNGNANRVICALKGTNSSNDPEVNISDLLNDNIGVFLYTGNAISGHYWLKISIGQAAHELTAAYNGQLSYVSGLGDKIYTNTSNKINNTTFINSSKISSINSNKFTNAVALGGNLPKRAICAYINRIDFYEGDNLTFYIGVRIKNNIKKKIEKPDLWLSGDITQEKTYKFN